MIEKIIRAIRLDPTLYNQVENDETETTNALIIVILVGVIGGIGAAIGAVFLSANPPGPNFPVPNPIMAFIGTVLNAVIGWVVWSFVVYFVGTRLYNAPATTGELLRNLGYNQSPLLLNILSGIPCLGWVIGLVAILWSLVTAFVATREALDLDNSKTLISIVLAALAVALVRFVLGAIFGLGAFGLGQLTGAFAR